jgi:hypothetical protein
MEILIVRNKRKDYLQEKWLLFVNKKKRLWIRMINRSLILLPIPRKKFDFIYVEWQIWSKR